MIQRHFWARFAAAILLAATACAPTGSQTTAPVPDPAPEGQDGAELAAALQRATLPASPRQIQFEWRLDEAGAGFRGRGVGRYVAPTRFRLDLFGPRGESYLAAALVDGRLRVPPAVEERFSLPSPTLLWAAAGIFHPGEARLIGVRTEDGVTTFRYDAGEDGTLEFRARDAGLVSVRRLRAGGIQESVDLQRGADGALREARYRDWPAFRTLTLTLQSSTDVPAFPDEVWSPPGVGR